LPNPYHQIAWAPVNPAITHLACYRFLINNLSILIKY
jgi:hypothetical protein